MKKAKLIFASIIVLANFLRAQNKTPFIPSKVPTVSIGAGVFTFNGDVGKGHGVDPYAYIRSGYQLNLEQRIHPMLGISLNALYGSVSKSERSGDSLRNKNFESKIIQLGLLATFHFDNDAILPKSFPVAPYISAGFAYVIFDPHGDLKGNKDQTTYKYWSDGSIRDIPENSYSALFSQNINRDYSYETQLKDSVTNYERTTFAVPIHAGIKFKLSDHWDVNLAANYNLTFSDYIDNVKDGKNDSYLYTHFTMTYIFGKIKSPEKKYVDVNVDFASIDKTDYDHDGVPDVDDQCQGTPPKIKVNTNGCPDDNDGDGVFDYMDKEKNTKQGVAVDANGVTISKFVMKATVKNSVATDRNEVFNENPSLNFLENIDAQIAGKVPGTLPGQFKSADKNGDGIISSFEITTAIDEFFEGNTDFTVEKLHALVDYFFEQ